MEHNFAIKANKGLHFQMFWILYDSNFCNDTGLLDLSLPNHNTRKNKDLHIP